MVDGDARREAKRKGFRVIKALGVEDRFLRLVPPKIRETVEQKSKAEPRVEQIVGKFARE
jgi:hypothetical protein